MPKMINRKSQTKIDDNRQSFVKNDAGFHPESDESLREYMHPGTVDHSYEDFRKAQGDNLDTRTIPANNQPADGAKGKPYTLLEDIYTLARHPLITFRKIRESRASQP